MPPIDRSVPGADGVDIHLLCWSEEGVPMLLLHGFGNEAHIWDDLAPRLAPYYRVVAMDLRGHGDSSRDRDARYDYDDHVRDVEAVTAALFMERLVLVGHSLGGRTATLFAGRHPERVAGLVIVDAGPELDPRGTTRISFDVAKKKDVSFASQAEYERELVHAYPAAQGDTLTRMARHGLRRRADGRLEPKTDPAYFAGRRVEPEAAEARERELSKRLWDALASVACPTLVVRGAASDVLSADTADRMVDEVLAQGRLEVLPAGHSVMTDDPEGLARVVCDFALG